MATEIIKFDEFQRQLDEFKSLGLEGLVMTHKIDHEVNKDNGKTYKVIRRRSKSLEVVIDDDRRIRSDPPPSSTMKSSLKGKYNDENRLLDNVAVVETKEVDNWF
jgi:hypothetical protein